MSSACESDERKELPGLLCDEAERGGCALYGGEWCGCGCDCEYGAGRAGGARAFWRSMGDCW
jgi:hypothetical protein